jgi:hypothetical protein
MHKGTHKGMRIKGSHNLNDANERACGPKDANSVMPGPQDASRRKRPYCGKYRYDCSSTLGHKTVVQHRDDLFNMHVSMSSEMSSTDCTIPHVNYTQVPFENSASLFHDCAHCFEWNLRGSGVWHGTICEDIDQNRTHECALTRHKKTCCACCMNAVMKCIRMFCVGIEAMSRTLGS